jgi:hypothetical protein
MKGFSLPPASQKNLILAASAAAAVLLVGGAIYCSTRRPPPPPKDDETGASEPPATQKTTTQGDKSWIKNTAEEGEVPFLSSSTTSTSSSTSVPQLVTPGAGGTDEMWRPIEICKGLPHSALLHFSLQLSLIHSFATVLSLIHSFTTVLSLLHSALHSFGSSILLLKNSLCSIHSANHPHHKPPFLTLNTTYFSQNRHKGPLRQRAEEPRRWPRAEAAGTKGT